MPNRISKNEFAVMIGETTVALTLTVEAPERLGGLLPADAPLLVPAVVEIPLKVGLVVVAPHWAHLSKLGRDIVRLLANRGESMTCPEIAEALHKSDGGKCKYVLGDMAERGILLSNTEGTRLNPPPQVAYHDFCKQILDWLDASI